jgi:hypothetical protein
MTFVPGKPKTGGRSKGTPNKKTLGLAEILESQGVEPVSELLKLMPNLTPKEQADVYKDLMAYLYPKRKAMEVSADPATLEQIKPTALDMVSLVDLIKRARGS